MSIEPSDPRYAGIRAQHARDVNSNKGNGFAQKELRAMSSGKWAGGKGDKSRVDPTQFREGMEALENAEPREVQPPCGALISEWQRTYNKKTAEINSIMLDLQDTQNELNSWLADKSEFLNLEGDSNV